MRSRRLAVAGLVVAVLSGVGCARPATSPTSTEPSLSASTLGTGTLLADPDLAPADRQAWLDRLDRTIQTLAGAGLAPLDEDWDGRLVVELPPTAQAYTALAGTLSGEAAAVTRCPDAGARITVNPVVAAEGTEYLDSLLLHEGVHLATGSSCRGRAPQWAEEGVAEWLASEHSGAALEANRQWVISYLAEHPVPATLPADGDFYGPSDQVSAAYALARQAVASAVDRVGRPAAMALLDGYYDGTADEQDTRGVTAWYVADLQRLSGSAQR